MKTFFFVLCITCISFLNAQTTVVLQPDGKKGKDALIDSRLSAINFAEHKDFPAIAWTNGGTRVDVRSLIDFDLSSIPAGATILSASLTLYSYDSPGNGSHSTQSGSNECVLSRITSTWEEATVTWDTQPSTTDEYQVVLAESTDPIQNYYNIDVSGMVRDMKRDPENSFGFQLRLRSEEAYRRMIFASSDHSDASLHPKLVVRYTEAMNADTCLLLKPRGNQGKDAFVDSRLSTSNYGNHRDFPAIAWTNGGSRVDVRALIDFDLSGIPDNAIVRSAALSLFSYDSPSNGAHSAQSGSNASVLSRVTSAWDEKTVSWDTQPSTSTENQVGLSASSDPIQHYTSIDVTKLVRDMNIDPDNSYGFQLRLETEEAYRRMIFASSDNPDESLHPELGICYSHPTSVTEASGSNRGFSLFPNPASDELSIDVSAFANQEPVSIDIVNATGQLISRNAAVDTMTSLDISQYARGIYYVKVYTDRYVSTQKLVIE